jgi:hypothetical protein
MDIVAIINSIDWNTLNWDLFVVIIFAVGLLVYNFFLGRDRVFIILISSYISLALLSKTPLVFETFNIQINNSFANTTAIFIGCVIVLFFILSYSAFTSVFDRSPAGTIFQTIIISFLQIGFAISVIISFLSPEEINSLSVFIKSVFAENQAQFFWLLAPLISMLLFKGRRRMY